MLRLLPQLIWSIELDAKPLYICLKSNLQKIKKSTVNGFNASEKASTILDFFNDKIVYYVSAFLEKSSFPKNITRHEQLKVRLSDIKTKNALFPGIAYCDDKYFERGFFVAFEKSHCTGKADQRDFEEERSLIQLAAEFGTNMVMKIHHNISEEKSLLYIRCLNGHDAEEYEVVEVSAPEIHPAFIATTNSIYHSLERVNSVLDDSDVCEGVEELRKICSKYIDPGANLPLKAKNPVIVIEGLDATGKTTLTKNLGKYLDATVLKSPPECICHLRSKFDSCPQLIRRAFYSLGNYAFAAMIQEAANDGIVIVDRFWNSTAAYAIATDVDVGDVENLPPPGHWVYSWPSDLLEPHAIFLLTISDEERRRRLTNRGSIKTDEEIRMERSRLFRNRLEESYKRMENPSMQVIDASGNEEEVLDRTLEILKSAGLLDALSQAQDS